MIKIRIVSSNNDWIKRQIPSNDQTIGDCLFIFDNTIACDYCFVIDSVSESINIDCPKENTILCVGEPKSVKIYPKSYYSQFGRVASHYRFRGIENIPINIPLLPWMIGVRFDLKKRKWDSTKTLPLEKIDKLSPGRRMDKIVILTSNKTLTKGHKKRLKFAMYLKEKLPDVVDLYGAGFEDFEDKIDILCNYKYALVIENSQFRNYVTEKLFDTYIAECLPLYIGCPNIGDYINNNSYIPLKMEQSKFIVEFLRTIIQEETYNKYKSQIIGTKQLIMNKYNLVNLIAEFVKKDFNLERKSENRTINPLERTFYEKLESKLLMKYYQLLY